MPWLWLLRFSKQIKYREIIYRHLTWIFLAPDDTVPNVPVLCSLTAEQAIGLLSTGMYKRAALILCRLNTQCGLCYGSTVLVSRP